MFKVYNNFDEIEEFVRNNAPAVVYKYRDWNDDFHKRIITDNEVWFSHPHKLNDPYDVRPPYNFIAENIDWEQAREKIKKAGRAVEPHLTNDELEHEVKIRLAKMQKDIIAYFTANRQQYTDESSNYDTIGIFSCCESGLNGHMWECYSDNHRGFAIGFNTIELARAMNCTGGRVTYDDTPIDFYIFGDNLKNLGNELMQKYKEWSVEEELRFASVGVGLIRERACNFPPEAVSEIIFGLNTPEDIKKEIMEKATISFPGVPFFQIQQRETGELLKGKL